MSKEIDDSTHPANIDDEAKKAAMAELESEDAEEQDTTTDESEQTDTSESEQTEEGDAPAAGKDDDQADDGKVDKKAFDGVLAELRATREEMKALKAQQTAIVSMPDARDFKAEREKLKDQWESGDIDTDLYNEQREAIVLEEAEYRAAVKFSALQQKTAQDTATAAWQEKVSTWERDNSDFLANPLRRKAVSDLLGALDSDPENRLTDDELLAEVEKQAFDAFNWQSKADTPPVDARRQAAARAAAAASSAPPAIAGGVGNAAHAAKMDLEALASNVSKAGAAKRAVHELLGDEA